MKPSQRLNELLREERVWEGRAPGRFQSSQCRAIIRFLDEQQEATQKLISRLEEAVQRLDAATETLNLVGDANALRAKLESWKGKIDTVIRAEVHYDDGEADV